MVLFAVRVCFIFLCCPEPSRDKSYRYSYIYVYSFCNMIRSDENINVEVLVQLYYDLMNLITMTRTLVTSNSNNLK
jgi:hypothetical protein